jgi:Polyketide cyclase / dehydrase and lipid transport
VRTGVTALLALGLLAPAGAAAAVIERLETTHAGDRYTLSFDVVLDAERSKVWQIMTDYEHLPRVSHVIVESHLLKSPDPERPRVGVTLRACVLIFCKTMKKVVDIEARPQSDITVTGVPELSDFSYSVERWRVSAEDGKTRLRYHAEMVPDFFIPPVIGPWLVRHFLEREIKATAIKVEELARHD